MKTELNRFVAAKLAASPRIQSQEDDILQETYIRACKEIGSLRINNTNGLMAWLKAIALNQIRDASRQQSAAKRGGDRVKMQLDREVYADRALGLAMEFSDSSIGSPSKYVARGEAIDAIKIALGQLPEAQRTAIQLHFFQQYSVNEIGLRMGRSSDSIRGLIQRAKKKLTEFDGCFFSLAKPKRLTGLRYYMDD